MPHDGRPAGHDKLSSRLSKILLRLNQGECLRPPQLAQEFGVSLHTIQRDLGHRFASLPLERSDDGYRLDPHHLGQLSWCDLERFADHSGIGGLYPRLEPRFLRDLLSGRLDSTLHVQGADGEDLRPRQREFAQFEQAIQRQHHIRFYYTKDNSTKLADGSLIVSTRVAHANQILPIVRYWLPNARILSLASLQAELAQGIRNYLGNR